MQARYSTILGLEPEGPSQTLLGQGGTTEFARRSWTDIQLGKSRPEWRNIVCTLCVTGTERGI